MKYIAKKETWFKEGTECKLEEDYSDQYFKHGLFSGIHIIDDDQHVKTFWENIPNGTEVEDREVCMFDEFDIIED